METTRLAEVRSEIEALYANRDDGLEDRLCRYQTLLKQETSLLEQRNSRHVRLAIEQRGIVGPHAAPHAAIPHVHSG